MNPEHANAIESKLSDDALVIDVGGAAAAFARADWVVDLRSYDQRGSLLTVGDANRVERFSRDTWVQLDICSRQKWPFGDNQFDYAVCSHVLEDVRDPIWVCSEISRIAKAGYIEVPSRIVEQSIGVEHPRLAGYYHHRWLVSSCDGVLEFRHKPHLLHTTRAAIIARLGGWQLINPRHAITTHFWEDELRCREILEFNEDKVIRELSEYSRRARTLPELVVNRQGRLADRLRRSIYYARLRWS